MVVLREDDMWELEGDEVFGEFAKGGGTFLVTEERGGGGRGKKEGS
jgi:hypothetical protein